MISARPLLADPAPTRARPPLAAARWVTFPENPVKGRVVVPYEGGPPDAARAVPFPIARVFSVTTAEAGASGGAHAHRRCQQLIICLAGTCRLRVIGDTALSYADFDLAGPGAGVHVPAGLWAEQSYGPAGSVIMVLTDRLYEADDYIRDFAQYLAFRAGTAD